MSVPDINREPDWDRLLNLKALSTWTLDRQREHASDRAAYEAALASFQAHLRSQVVEGDGRWSAARRSRKVERSLKALVKAARKSEKAAGELRTDYAAHVAHVAALPAQREAKALAKEGRRDTLRELTARSLHRTAQAAQEQKAVEQQPAPAAPAVEPAADQAPSPRGINALWRAGA